MSIKKLLPAVLLFTVFQTQGQNRYLVRFTDKSGTNYELSKPEAFLSARAIERRNSQGLAVEEQDLPVSAEYLQALKAVDVKILGTSKWLNAAMIDIPEKQLQTILDLEFIDGLEMDFPNGLSTSKARKGTKDFSSPWPLDAGTANNQLEMLGADAMHNQGFRGEGVLIGILDSGFQNANSLDVFKNMFAENRVLDTYDFVHKKTGVYDTHYHGTHVLSCIAADLEGQMIGTAPKASVALYLTEDVGSETQIEEMNWIMAAERADSLGVDVISSSLGYNDFDGTAQDYVYDQLDGKTTLITRAANWAANKGIVVVVSAGNEGSSLWKYITPPADSPMAIAVAAVDSEGKKGSFSSFGPTADNRIKPDVAAKGVGTTIATPANVISLGNGTSYAAPLIAGLVAGMVQAFPDLTALQIRELLLESSSQFDSPDNDLGYGIPSFVRASALVRIEQLRAGTDKSVLTFPNPSGEKDNITVFVTKKDLGDSFNLELYNTNGVKVLETKFSSPLFELSKSEMNIPPGLYYLKVYNDRFEETTRVVIY
ncbi:S8 family serine peptidase [Marinilongibacter aquaticus]|uniref:S8 family serine peptidase n=1 Tax=Marinilongibacter aquaticus TaxID=2975157 RepID=UPI0021BD1406|nr:S8 family serine peptidase [Marinilongibacter aquaticus]UBM59426.1 S8 family serine peptidase [Marinilongibacter aquaticus]